MLSRAHPILSAIKWNYAGAIARVIVTFVVGTIIARTLGPEPYGAIAVASLLISLGGLIADAGVSTTLVQRMKISEDEIRYSFTVQLALGFAFGILYLLVLPLCARYFHVVQWQLPLLMLAAIFPLQSLGQTALSLAQRQMSFRVLQSAQIASYVLGYGCVGLPMALMGFGIWSLVLSQLLQSIANSIFCLHKISHPKKLIFKNNPSMALQGMKIMGNNIACWVISNMDNFIVGRLYGATNLGLYSRAYSFAMMPSNLYASTLQQVLYPTYSRAQEDLKKLAMIHRVSTWTTILLLFPISGAVASISEVVITAIYGRKWIAAAQLFTPLILAFPFEAITGINGALMTGLNLSGRQFKIQALVGVLAISLYLGSKSVWMLAWSVLLIAIIRCTYMCFTVSTRIKGYAREFFTALSVGFLIMSATTSVVTAGNLLQSKNVSMGFRLCSDLAIALAAQSLCVALVINFVPRCNAILREIKGVQENMSLIKQGTSVDSGQAIKDVTRRDV